MEATKKRRLLGVVPFVVGMVTALLALELVGDPNTRHIVAALGVAIQIAGVVILYRARSEG